MRTFLTLRLRRIWHVIFITSIDMGFINKHISIETVPGKSYCRVDDDSHFYFIPSEMVQEVEDYVHKSMFSELELASLKDWYLSLPMKKRISIIVVLNEKIA